MQKQNPALVGGRRARSSRCNCPIQLQKTHERITFVPFVRTLTERGNYIIHYCIPQDPPTIALVHDPWLRLRHAHGSHVTYRSQLGVSGFR
jgi:hypothetical protein